jgi:hypothetical protein
MMSPCFWKQPSSREETSSIPAVSREENHRVIREGMDGALWTGFMVVLLDDALC